MTSIKSHHNGLGWVVVLASFVLILTINGVIYFTITFYQYIEEFDDSFKYLYITLDLFSSLLFISGPISSMLVNRYGYRYMTILGSLMVGIFLLISSVAHNMLTLLIICFGTGIGLGLMYLSAIFYVTIYFDKLRSFATGITLSSCNSMYIFHNILKELNFKNYDLIWRDVIQILTVLAFICAIFTYLLLKLKVFNENAENGIKQIPYNIKKDLSEKILLFKNPTFSLFTISLVLLLNGNLISNIYLDRKINSLKDYINLSDYLKQLTDISTIVSCILFGFVSSIFKVNKLSVYSVSILVSGIANGLVVFCQSYTSLSIYCAIIGITGGANLCLLTVVLVELVGLEKFSNSFGIIMFFIGVSSIFGNELGISMIKENMNGSEFIFASAFLIISSVTLFPIYDMQRNDKKNQFEIEGTVPNDDISKTMLDTKEDCEYQILNKALNILINDQM